MSLASFAGFQTFNAVRNRRSSAFSAVTKQQHALALAPAIWSDSRQVRATLLIIPLKPCIFSMQVDAAASQAPDGDLQLLQLPGTGLSLVLQQLDPCSRACTAAACSALSRAVPAAISNVSLQCRTPETLRSLSLCLEQHSLTNLVQCSISIDHEYYVSLSDTPLLDRLPCPQLRQLQLEDVRVQFEAADGGPGLLHDCTGLTGLELQRCQVQDPRAAFAAIAALSELQRLRWVWVSDSEDRSFFAELQHPAKLTHLRLDCDGWYNYDFAHFDDDEQPCFPELDAPLSQLSALVNLKHLHLTDIPGAGIPGGLPLQLSKLTSLVINFAGTPDVAEQMQQLSALTELKDFQFSGRDSAANSSGMSLANKLSGIGHLLRLTSLHLSAHLHFSTNTTANWACLTALQDLSLRGVKVQPQALAALTQLQALSLRSVDRLYASHVDLSAAVAQLTRLTELKMHFNSLQFQVDRPSLASFTALTASTILCSLGLSSPVIFARGGGFAQLMGIVPGCVLMEPGRVYPQLRDIDLDCALWGGGLPLSEQQLQVLCSCCPAVESLAFVLEGKASTAAYLPLLQLSALTHLEMQQKLMFTVATAAAAAAAAVAATPAATAAVGVAAQLTGLKQLAVWGVPGLMDPLLLQLTALQALEKLTLYAVSTTGGKYILDGPKITLLNKARGGSPPDVWLQLQRHLSASA